MYGAPRVDHLGLLFLRISFPLAKHKHKREACKARRTNRNETCIKQTSSSSKAAVATAAAAAARDETERAIKKRKRGRRRSATAPVNCSTPPDFPL